MKDFHRQFVLVPADKAANNIIIVCKKFYLEVVCKELYCLDSSSPHTYIECTSDSGCIVEEHLNYMKKGKIDVPLEMHELPKFYWLPKMHKSPYGCRFIAASSKCTTKPLSSILTSCFTTILTHFKEYCDGIYRNTGVNAFWIINNSQQALKVLHEVNGTSRALHMDSFDFSTLYTKIPHDSLKSNLKDLIQEAYKIRGAKFLCVRDSGTTYWSVSRSTHRDIDEKELFDMLEFLIDNVYIEVGNKVFRQRVGIPMGTNCAPLIANLFLFFYEYKYMRYLLKNNYQLARKCSNTVRYIDDLLTLNNSSFESEIPNIYPSELELKRTTESPLELSYLDITIRIDCNRFVTTLYDKRDVFQFYIVNFPYLDSNIPTGPAYGTYMSQLVRIGRICEDFASFASRNRKLTSRLLKQGFWYRKLCLAFKKFSKKHKEIFSKFKTSLRQHIAEGICLPACTMRHLTTNVTKRRSSGIVDMPCSTIS